MASNLATMYEEDEAATASDDDDDRDSMPELVAPDEQDYAAYALMERGDPFEQPSGTRMSQYEDDEDDEDDEIFRHAPGSGTLKPSAELSINIAREATKIPLHRDSMIDEVGASRALLPIVRADLLLHRQSFAYVT